MIGRCSRILNVILLAGMALAMSRPAHSSLIHQYVFDGDVKDQVAGGVDGTLVGGATAAGGVLTLDGTGWVTFGNNFLVPVSGDYTVMLFAKYTYNGAIHEFISQGGSGGPGFYIGPYGDEMRMGDSYYGWTATPHFYGSCRCTGVEAPSDGEWHHYALVVSGGSAEFFIDGVLRATRGGYSIGGYYPTVLGSQFGGNWELFQGSMKDVRIYDNALTSEQVASISSGTSEAPEPGSATLMGGALVGASLLARRRLKR